MSDTITIVIAADHAGVCLKAKLAQVIAARGLRVLDIGTGSAEQSVDYPDFGFQAAQKIADGVAQMGVVICGSGIGISIAANRHPNIRAALCTTPEMAQLARAHNDANILALGARIIDEQTAIACLEAFLDTPFEGGRHQQRIDKLSRSEFLRKEATS
tara:strand:+ start:283 stop:756 length:474 start_codon:yes stop_codon:yes gene_type:complete